MFLGVGFGQQRKNEGRSGIVAMVEVGRREKVGFVDKMRWFGEFFVKFGG